MLAHSQVATRLPAKDLERATRFYSEKLALTPVEKRPGGLLYQCGSAYFALFESAGASSGTHTQMAWEVADIEATVAALRARGVVFEEYDLPGLKTVNGIAEIEGNYPSKVSASERRGSETARAACSASASRFSSLVLGERLPIRTAVFRNQDPETFTIESRRISKIVPERVLSALHSSPHRRGDVIDQHAVGRDDSRGSYRRVSDIIQFVSHVFPSSCDDAWVILDGGHFLHGIFEEELRTGRTDKWHMGSGRNF